MGVLAVANLLEGMTIRTDVFDRSGRLLLGSDTILVGKHLRMFRMWGITEVDIAGVDDLGKGEQALLQVDSEHLLAAEQELRPLFHNVNFANPFMEELFRLCLLRKVCNESH